MRHLSFKSLPALLLLLYGAHASAQNSQGATGNLKRDSVTAVKPTQKNKLWLAFDVEPQFDAVMVAAKDKPLMRAYGVSGGLAAGFEMNCQIGSTAGFETGLQYRFSDIKAAGNYGSSDEQFHSIQLPALLTLHTHRQKARFFCAAGFAVGADVVDRYRQQYTGSVPIGADPVFSRGFIQTDGVSSVYCWFISKAGVEVNVSENTVIKIGASFNVSATSYTSLGYNEKLNLPFVVTPPVPVAPYSVGVNVAVLFGVKTHVTKIRK